MKKRTLVTYFIAAVLIVLASTTISTIKRRNEAQAQTVADHTREQQVQVMQECYIDALAVFAGLVEQHRTKEALYVDIDSVAKIFYFQRAGISPIIAIAK